MIGGMSLAAEVGWHDAECGGYGDDLAIWEELAQAQGGPVLDLGCGTGRVALHLARHGHEVEGLDLDAGLVATLRQRAAAEGLSVRARIGDVRKLAPERRYSLVIAAMQLMQVLGPEDRAAALRVIASALAPGGLAGLAIVEGAVSGEAEGEVLPDVREVDGWVYSSLPLGVHSEDGRLVSRRLRQTVSPGGELTEEQHEDLLAVLDADTLAAEAQVAGLSTIGTRRIGESERYVGSTVLLLRGEN